MHQLSRFDRSLTDERTTHHIQNEIIRVSRRETVNNNRADNPVYRHMVSGDTERDRRTDVVPIQPTVPLAVYLRPECR